MDNYKNSKTEIVINKTKDSLLRVKDSIIKAIERVWQLCKDLVTLIVNVVCLVWRLICWLLCKDDVAFNDYCLENNNGQKLGFVLVLFVFLFLNIVPNIFSVLYYNAKSLNQSYISKKPNIYCGFDEINSCDLGLCDIYDINAVTLTAIYNALDKKHASNNVILCRESLPMVKEYINGMNFTYVSDVVFYLYSKGIRNELEKVELSIVPDSDDDDTFIRRVKQMALEQFGIGDYYASSEYVDMFFQHYCHRNQFDVVSRNNEMHLLKLLLQPQYRWVLTTNRELAKQFYSIILDIKYDNEIKEVDFADNDELKDLVSYFKGIVLFNKYDFLGSLEIFSDCYNNTSDNMIKQYCALMSIRCAWWSHKKNKNIDMFDEILNRYSPEIIFPYFSSDLMYYEEWYEL